MWTGLIAAVVVSVVPALGCGGGDPAVVDAAVDGEPPLDAASLDALMGDNHTYVMSAMVLPGNSFEATALGLDIDDVLGDPNQGIDNQLGIFFGALGGLSPGINTSTQVAAAIDRGLVVQLMNLKSFGLVDAPTAGVWVYLGDPGAVTPAACTDANDTVCRHHLDGTGVFAKAPDAPLGSELDGAIHGGRFIGGPGPGVLDLRVPVIGAGGLPLRLTLHRAKADLRVTDTGVAVGSKLGGAITHADIESQFYPAWQAHAEAAIAADCPTPRSPPTCSCGSGTAGQSMIDLFDAAPRDCAVTLGEVRSTLSGLLTDDLDLFDSSGALHPDGVNDSVSFGFGVTAVRGAFVP
jgi:hypothetical protein